MALSVDWRHVTSVRAILRATMGTRTFEKIIARLEKHYGKPQPPPETDPWSLILWENVAYLANDARRRAAFFKLRKRFGTKPSSILAASDDELLAVTTQGILAERFVEKLRECARTALELYPDTGGDLTPLLELPAAKAKKALSRFPGIGQPGAEKILLFGGAQATLALESNGLRVLTRIGYGEEKKSYSTTYRLVRAALEPELPAEVGALVEAHQLLRRHGMETCKRSAPRCQDCPVRSLCDYAPRKQ